MLAWLSMMGSGWASDIVLARRERGRDEESFDERLAVIYRGQIARRRGGA